MGASGIWLASPHAPLLRQRRTAGVALASLGLILICWQLPCSGGGVVGGLVLIVSAVLLAAAAGSIVAQQARIAAGCFGLMLAAVLVLFLLLGAWPMALVVAVLSGVVFAAGKFTLVGGEQSWLGIRRETDSWEPMLASATGAVVAGTLATMISRGIGDEALLVHNMAIVGVLLLGIGLLGLISRISTARMFLALGVVLAGAAAAAISWSGPAWNRSLADAALPMAIVAGSVGGMWIAAAMLLVRLGDGSHESPADKPAGRMNTGLYALLTAVGLVVLAGVLRIGT